MKAAEQNPPPERYVLRLYVTERTTRSGHAVEAIRDLCREHLKGRYDLEIIDIQKHPELARDRQIIAVPTLVRELPEPLRHLIGDLSDTERVLWSLDVRTDATRGSGDEPDHDA